MLRSTLNIVAICGLALGVGFFFAAMNQWWTRIVPFFVQRGDYLPVVIGAAPWIGLAAFLAILFLDSREGK